MNRFRPLVLAAATLLFISACSTPEDLTAPTLEPQFGSAEDDIGIDVATLSTGRIYVLSKENGPFEGHYGLGGHYSKAILSRYDGSGNLAWNRVIESHECSDDGDYGYYMCPDVDTISVATNSQGYVYALTTRSYLTDWNSSEVAYTVYKYSASGSYVAAFNLPYGDGSEASYAEFAVDGSGNIFITHSYTPAEDWSGNTPTPQNVVAKYSPSGTLQWQRTSTVGIPYATTVSSSGSVYVVGTTGLARYTNSGGLTWSKAASNSKGVFEDAGNLVISGSYIYTRSGKDIRKYDSTGRQLWLRTQSGLNTLVLKDVTGDTGGNIYISGKYQASTGNTNAFVRKINASGSILWTKTFGTSAYDEARGAATISGSEIYVTGQTQGSLAHTNIGGSDAYLRKLNSSGNPVWTR